MVSPKELSEIRSTIKDQMNKGHSKEEIRKTMRNAGYSKDIVDLAFSKSQPEKSMEVSKVGGGSKLKVVIAIVAIVVVIVAVLLIISNTPVTNEISDFMLEVKCGANEQERDSLMGRYKVEVSGECRGSVVPIDENRFYNLGQEKDYGRVCKGDDYVRMVPGRLCEGAYCKIEGKRCIDRIVEDSVDFIETYSGAANWGISDLIKKDFAI